MTAQTREVAAPKVVLITGGASFLGSSVAARLAKDRTITRVIAVDSVEPEQGPEPTPALGRAEFRRMKLSHPDLARLLAEAEVDTVVHAAVSQDPPPPGAGETMKERNVLGTMQLLAACQRAPGVRRLVVKSSAAVYGASARDPALFTEQMEAHAVRGSYAKDVVEIEGYVRGFGRRRPDVVVTILRFANMIGAQLKSPFTDYLAMPVVPTVLGHDARIQLLHSDDALAVLELAVRGDAAGTVNVGGEGILMLSQALRRAGRIAVALPAPLVGQIGGLLQGSRRGDWSSAQVNFLNFGRAVDCSLLAERYGYRPQWSTVAAFDDFARARGLRSLPERGWVQAAQTGAVAALARLR